MKWSGFLDSSLGELSGESCSSCVVCVMWKPLESVALEAASWSSRGHQKKPEQTRQAASSSSSEHRRVSMPVEEKRSSSGQREGHVWKQQQTWVGPGLHGFQSMDLGGEEEVAISPVSREDALTGEGWFDRKS